jgi:hypothetical protein
VPDATRLTILAACSASDAHASVEDLRNRGADLRSNPYSLNALTYEWDTKRGNRKHYQITPQTGRSPSLGRGQADIGVSDARSSRAEKIAQFLSSDLVLVHGTKSLFR